MKGTRVVVLGGTSGLGLSTAKAVAAAGGSVVVASRSQAGVDRGLSALPDGAEGYPVDVTDEPAVRDLFDRIGSFDHLVYTAGEPLLNGRLKITEIEAIRRFFNTRYFGALTAAKYATPLIRPGGSISFVSGTASFRPDPGTVGPASVLAAIEGMTRALAVELAPIRVNAVVPGILRSELWGHLPAQQREAMFESVASGQLVGRRLGEPRDVAEAFMYLMRAKHTTGSTLTIDGGSTLA
jgi:NAD(P)-dependent dehydrogenase (short-subunit alcohol dehydrogenase family)